MHVDQVTLVVGRRMLCCVRMHVRKVMLFRTPATTLHSPERALLPPAGAYQKRPRCTLRSVAASYTARARQSAMLMGWQPEPASS
jgi:hypothetical protein